MDRSAIHPGGVLTTTGCGGGGVGTPPKVIASNSQIADLVKQVGGDAVNIAPLAPPAVNPHSWMPPSDAANLIKQAKLVFHAGGNLEPWFNSIYQQSGSTTSSVDLSQSVKLIGSGSKANDHWITDLDNAQLAAKKIADELTTANPKAAKTYSNNLAKFDSAARNTDETLVSCSTLVKPADRRVVAGHDDLAYLARRYQLKIVAKIVRSGEDVPTSADRDRAFRQAKAGKARVVAPSWSEVDTDAALLAQQLGVTKIAVFTDSLSDLTPSARTLLGSINYSVRAILLSVSNGKIKC